MDVGEQVGGRDGRRGQLPVHIQVHDAVDAIKNRRHMLPGAIDRNGRESDGVNKKAAVGAPDVKAEVAAVEIQRILLSAASIALAENGRAVRLRETGVDEGREREGGTGGKVEDGRRGTTDAWKRDEAIRGGAVGIEN